MKTLLITDVPPSRKASGTLLTWHLCKNFNPTNLVGYFLVSRGLENMPAEFPFDGEVKYVRKTKSYDGTYRPDWLPRRLRFIASFTREMYRRYVEVPRYTQDVVKFARENGVDHIWIILQGQTMIWMAERLLKSGEFPVHIQVWDSPRWWIKAHGMDRISGRMLRDSYAYCLEYAARFASASFPMAEEYSKKFKKPSEVFIGIIPDSYIIDEFTPKDESKFVIGIAGQIYATDTFKGLIRALDFVYWEIDGRKVEIHYWGTSELPKHRTRIIRKGYIGQDQLTKALSACDLLYCPYWFDVHFKEECETSFPSKLVTYLASNTLVFFHGPEYSSPVKLLEESNAAICCMSNHADSILMHLRKSIYVEDREQIIKNAKKLLNGKLGENYLHQSFKNFMELT